MSYKEKFDEIIGIPFEFEEAGYPDYVVTTGPSRFLALVDMKKFEDELIWKPFVVKGLPTEGHVYFDNICFNVQFIHKAMEVVDPKQYSVYKQFLKSEGKDSFMLVLRNGNYAIFIAPAIPKEGDKEERKDLEKYIKEPPKSVFVL